MKMNVRMYPMNKEQVDLLKGLKNKYKFGSERFYKSFDETNSTIRLFDKKIKVDKILLDQMMNGFIVTSFIIQEGIQDDMVLEVTGYIRPTNTVKTKYVERHKTARTY